MQIISLNQTWSVAERTSGAVANQARNMWLASLGAASLTRKEIAKIFSRMVKEGTVLENQSRDFLRRARSRSEERVSKVTEQVSRTAGRARTVLARQIDAEPAVYHLVPKDEDWAVRREGHDADISVHPNKKSALAAARGIAQAHEPSRLVIHRADGTIQSSHSYEEQE